MQSRRVMVWSVVALLAIATMVYVRSVWREPAESTTRIYFLTGGKNPFWQLTMSGARAAAQEYNAEVQFGVPDETPQEQTRLLADVGSTKCEGLAVSPLAPDSQTELLNRLSESMHVVTFDSDAPLSRRKYYVGTHNNNAGSLCAELVRESLPQGGKVALLMRTLDKDNARLRHEGFVEELSQSAWRVRQKAENASDDTNQSPVTFDLVETLIDDADPEKCARNLEQLLSDHPDIGAIVGMFAYQGPIMLDVLQRQDKLGKIQLVTFDEDERVLQGISDGHIYATVIQDPFKYGYEAVRMLTVLARKGEAELPISEGSIYLPCQAIKKHNLDVYRKKLEHRMPDA